MNNIYDIFRIPIYVGDTDLNNKEMADYCLSIKNKDNGRSISNQGGWQSNDLQGIHLPLNKLFKEVTTAVNIFAKDLQFPSQKIDNIWININGYKDYNQEHRHPNSNFSGVYYVQTSTECGELSLVNPNVAIMESYWWPTIKDNDNSRTNLNWNMPAESGKLYVFPSWLPHRVTPNMDKNKVRISLSWNTIAQGQ